jgi:DNA-binding response OmpR family regulator
VTRGVGFVTGDILNPDRREFLESAGRPIIGKPFEPDEVREVVQRLLRQ